MNAFYSTYRQKENKHEFDIWQLPETQYRSLLTVFTAGSGKSESTGYHYKTTQKDYDEKFRAKILELSPSYKLNEFLDYHLNYFLSKHLGQRELFLRHIRYEILPYFKVIQKEVFIDLINEWLTQFNTTDIKPDNPMQIKVGDNSVVQIQNNTINSSQYSQITVDNFRKLEQMVLDIKNAMDLIAQNLNSEQTEDLKQDIDILEKAMKKKEPNISIVQTLYKGIVDILKSVPGNVIANVIAGGLPEINF